MNTADARSSGKRVFLHVGEPKTGTTFLQMVLWTNRAELAAQGVIYPGARPNAHWRATQDVREVTQDPLDPAPPFAGAWDDLIKRAFVAGNAAVISHELFAGATREQARRALSSLDGAELHLVLTVRDLGSLLPAEWQETVKHGNSGRWVHWISSVVRESEHPDERRPGGGTGFWRVHDTMAVIDRWVDGVIPPERVHVITMPSRTADESLWDRFARVLGIDPSLIDTTKARTNVSLGIAEVELIRRLNEQLRDDYPGWSYQWFVKDTIAHATFPQREMSERLQMFPDREEWAAKQADQLINRLVASGYDIVGDLDELRPKPVRQPVLVPGEVGDAVLLDRALFAMTGLLDRMNDMRDELNIFRRRFGHVTEDVPEYSAWKNALIALSDEYPWLGRARRGYWRAMGVVRHTRRKALSRPGAQANPQANPQAEQRG